MELTAAYGSGVTAAVLERATDAQSPVALLADYRDGISIYALLLHRTLTRTKMGEFPKDRES